MCGFKITLGAGLLIFVAWLPYLVNGDAAAVAAAAATAVAVDGGAVAAACAAATTVAAYETSRPAPVTVHRIHCYNCNDNYKPVCGSNGITYSNECLLRCVSKDHAKYHLSSVSLLHHGKCRPAPCNCPKNVYPVCGTNNQTYINDCYRICDNTYRAKYKLPPIGIKYRDFCRRPLCICPRAVIPVCGTNGLTYRNICFLQCYSKIEESECRHPFYLDSVGSCKEEKCKCSLKKKEICASDNKTYYNYCALECENRLRHQLDVDPIVMQYPGDCIRCMCTADVNPVCGSDGVTYSNHCWLLCENKKRRRQCKQDLTIRWKGPCNCCCDKKEWKPLCVSDCTTWPNKCQVDCENRKRELNCQTKLDVLYSGECKPCCRADTDASQD